MRGRGGKRERERERSVGGLLWRGYLEWVVTAGGVASCGEGRLSGGGAEGGHPRRERYLVSRITERARGLSRDALVTRCLSCLIRDRVAQQCAAKTNPRDVSCHVRVAPMLTGGGVVIDTAVNLTV